MKPPLKTYLVAAYATTPSLLFWDQEATYFSALATCPDVMGIEHPFFLENNKYPLPWLLENIPAHWSIMVTALPSLMQLLQQDPDCGIASEREASRQLAVQHIAKICEYVHTLHRAFDRPVVKAVHIQTSPANSQIAIRGDKRALQRSLIEIRAMDWQNTALQIEHCDAYTPSHSPEKGFLSLEDEIEAIQRVGGWGIVLNWARSAIEAQDVIKPLQHLRQTLEAGLLRGFFFSGCTDQKDNPYGEWKDSHMPPDNVAPGSLLNQAAIQSAQALLPEAVYQGIKVSARPIQTSPTACAQLNIRTLATLQSRGGEGNSCGSSFTHRPAFKT